MESLRAFVFGEAQSTTSSPSALIERINAYFTHSKSTPRFDAGTLVTVGNDEVGIVIEQLVHTPGAFYDRMGTRKDVLVAVSGTESIQIKEVDARVICQLTSHADVDRLRAFHQDRQIAVDAIVEGALVRPRRGYVIGKTSRGLEFLSISSGSVETELQPPLVILAVNGNRVRVAGFNRNGGIDETEVRACTLALLNSSS